MIVETAARNARLVAAVSPALTSPLITKRSHFLAATFDDKSDVLDIRNEMKPFLTDQVMLDVPAAACVEAPMVNEARPAYLDNNATTPLDPRVLDKMLPYMVSLYGNPHSRTHLFGWEAENAVEEAREQIGKLINARRWERDLIWTSGATECNNIAVKGVVEYALRQKDSDGDASPVHVITTQVEHKCVLASCRDLEQRYPGRVEVTYLAVNSEGLVDMAELRKAIRPGETCLVSIIAVHNEIGVVQDVKGISRICRDSNVIFHTDAAQAVGKIPFDVQDLGVDLVSMSGHKMYGPKGVGALYINSARRPRIRLEPQMSGGGQERGLRSGTVPSYLCIGMGQAAAVCEIEMHDDAKWVDYLSDKIVSKLKSSLSEIILNGSEEHRYKGNLNMSFDGIEGESLIMSLSRVCSISSGSACTSTSLEPSYVLRALGVDDELAHTSLRFGLGRFTTEEEVDVTLDALLQVVKKLRDISPLWELRQAGKAANIQWT